MNQNLDMPVKAHIFCDRFLSEMLGPTETIPCRSRLFDMENGYYMRVCLATNPYPLVVRHWLRTAAHPAGEKHPLWIVPMVQTAHGRIVSIRPEGKNPTFRSFEEVAASLETLAQQPHASAFLCDPERAHTFLECEPLRYQSVVRPFLLAEPL